jgi:hypothetical protein
MARNRFPGKCLRCRKDVPAGEGFFQRLPGRGWLVRCEECVGKGNEPVATPSQASAL